MGLPADPHGPLKLRRITHGMVSGFMSAMGAGIPWLRG